MIEQKKIKSCIAVGDVIGAECDHWQGERICTVEQIEVVFNSYPLSTPTEIVIQVKLSYEGNGFIKFTSDNFKYTRHISHGENEIMK